MSRLLKIKHDLKAIENSISWIKDSSNMIIMKHLMVTLNDIVKEIESIESKLGDKVDGRENENVSNATK